MLNKLKSLKSLKKIYVIQKWYKVHILLYFCFSNKVTKRNKIFCIFHEKSSDAYMRLAASFLGKAKKSLSIFFKFCKKIKF